MSHLEDTLAFQIRATKLPSPETEYRFDPSRRWRFDFAWPDRKVAVEVEGGTWTGGRHVRPAAFENDCVKYAEAAIAGWRVLRVTGDMLDDGRAMTLIARILDQGADR